MSCLADVKMAPGGGWWTTALMTMAIAAFITHGRMFIYGTNVMTYNVNDKRTFLQRRLYNNNNDNNFFVTIV